MEGDDYEKGRRFVVAIVIVILINVLSIGGVLWCRHISQTQEVPEGVESTVTIEGQLESYENIEDSI